MSSPELASTMPVRPPRVNSRRKPRQNSSGVYRYIQPSQSVLSQLKILIPVGMAMTIVAAEKYARVSISRPTVYMWCAHTMNPSKPIAIIAYIIPSLPNIGLEE